MKINFIKYLFLLLIINSCLPKTEILKPVSGQILRISDGSTFFDDTLRFDTLFGGQKSISKRLMVYNTADFAVNLDQVKLANNNAGYQIIVNGETGNSVTNVLLRSKDSIIIFVNIYFDNKNQTNKYVLDDELQITYQSITQSVQIRSFGKDATTIGGFTLVQNTIWDNSSVKYLKGDIIVPFDKTLTITAGTEVVAEKNVEIIVYGKLIIQGSYNQYATLSGSRQDYQYSGGQWQGISIMPGALKCEINWAKINGATNGVSVGLLGKDTVQNELEIQNTLISNISETAILMFNTKFVGSNLLITNCGNQCIAGYSGGDYQLFHATVYNFDSYFRTLPSVYFSDGNKLLTRTNNINHIINVSLINNIIWGKGVSKTGVYTKNEFQFDKDNNANWNSTVLENNFVKTSFLAVFSDTTNKINFSSPMLSFMPNKEYVPDTLSPVNKRGKLLPGYFQDMNQKSRSIGNTSIGAYQYY